jgi:hypothetical protein
MTTTRYKDFVVLLLAMCIALLVIDRCNHNKSHYDDVTELDNKVAELEADRMFMLDSVDMLNESLEAERIALTNRLDGYKMKPTKERIKLITLIDTFAIQTDTGAILSMHGVDSINKLTIHYQSCMTQSAVKDTIITHLSNVVQADSVIIASQQQSMKAHKKTAKIKMIKAAVISGLVGIIIGLVI